jgi:hypothetical protein
MHIGKRKIYDCDYTDDDVVLVHILEGCEINLAEIFYDTTETENDSDLETREKIIRALKASGVNMSDEQIKTAVNILESGS